MKPARLSRYRSTVRLGRRATLIAIGITVLIVVTIVVIVAAMPSPVEVD